MHTTTVPDRQLSWLDHVRLSKLLRAPRADQPLPPETATHARDLLDQAELIEPQRIDADIVTMRSRLRLARGAAGAMTLTLCYPDELAGCDDGLSVFSPLGLALLGARRGETIAWAGPDGQPHEAVVDAILYQPEAAGDIMR